MKEIIFGIKIKTKKNKKMILFLIGLAFIGFIAGSVFITQLSKGDQTLVKDYMGEYINLIRSNKIDYMQIFKNAILSNSIFTLVTWLLGISIIGIPIILLSYFIKSFTFGFSITSIIFKYKSKGLLISLIYIIPELLNFVIYTVLLIFAIKFSLKLIDALFKRKTLDFKILFSNYVTILILVFIGIFITAMIEAFIVPYFLHKLLLIR